MNPIRPTGIFINSIISSNTILPLLLLLTFRLEIDVHFLQPPLLVSVFLFGLLLHYFRPY